MAVKFISQPPLYDCVVLQVATNISGEQTVAACSLKMLVTTQQLTRCYNAKGHLLLDITNFLVPLL